MSKSEPSILPSLNNSGTSPTLDGSLGAASALSPTPSLSESTCSFGSSGNASFLSKTPSLSLSPTKGSRSNNVGTLLGSFGKSSLLSPIPSLSVSIVSFESLGNASALLPTPSPSVSTCSDGSFGNASSVSIIPSLSVSNKTSNGSAPLGSSPRVSRKVSRLNSSSDPKDGSIAGSSSTSGSFASPSPATLESPPSIARSGILLGSWIITTRLFSQSTS